MRATATQRPGQTIAVAMHGIEPATFERCAVIRDWLDDHGIDRVTLLVIPARDLHPVGERSPAMAEWLRERRDAGDSIAQHGFQHSRGRREGPARWLLDGACRWPSGEFVGLSERETRSAVHAGWRLLKLAGVEPDGFVAPAYAYTAALRSTLSLRFQWWAGLLRVHRTRRAHEPAWGGDEGEQGWAVGEGASPPPAACSLAPAWSLAARGPVTRLLAPSLVRAGAMLPMSTLRLDLHPAFLRHPRHMLALDWVLQRSASRRRAITYRELAES